ncbi:sulfotransferase family protein [Pseudomonas sp. DWP3-1-2]|uniref:sulfotransferase-like domain-containing protein n=1 Tax=Pseudomonas sp. DWP3-1-2 TaxID=2804645 RepID=UPI003CF93FAF
MNRMVALWAHPRSRSTVLERVFIERKDFEVFHEPFAHVAFNQDSSIPSDNLACGLPTTYEGVKALLREARQQHAVFHKDMCYHCLAELKADPAFLLEQDNIFIIREPLSSIRSHFAIYPQMPRDAIGHKAQYEVFCEVTRLTGRIPYVINADDLVHSPETTVRQLCDHLQLPFMPQALSWNQECPTQWLPWRSWHKAAEQSTHIHSTHHSPINDTVVNSDSRLIGYYRFHRPYYERMNQFTKGLGLT